MQKVELAFIQKYMESYELANVINQSFQLNSVQSKAAVKVRDCWINSCKLFLSMISLAMKIRRMLFFYIEAELYFLWLSHLPGRCPTGPSNGGSRCITVYLPTFTFYV